MLIHTCRRAYLQQRWLAACSTTRDQPLAELIAITDRIAAAVDHWDEIPADVITELSSAIDLMRGGKACATVSALLAAHSDLNTATGLI